MSEKSKEEIYFDLVEKNQRSGASKDAIALVAMDEFAKQELEDKDIKLQALELAFDDKVKEIERLKGLIEAAFHYTPRLNTHWEEFKTENNLWNNV